MIVSGKAITLRDAKLEGAVVQVIRDWATAHPDELISLDRQMKGMRREREYMGKNMAHLAEIPVRLHNAMCEKIDRNWMDDKDLRRLFLEHFKVGCLNLGFKSRYVPVGG